MTALTRGPLPARVYWRRRLLLAAVLLALVVGAVRLAGLGSDPDPSGRPSAAPVAAEATTTPQPPEVTATDTPSETRTERAAPRQQGKRDRQPVLAEPEGVCSDRDVAVTPTVRKPVAGDPVAITLELRTIATPACTWQVSSSTLTVRLTSGADDIWSSQDCPGSVPKQDVVVRQDVGTKVDVTWSGRRSDDECSRFTEWAMPGWYYVDAAALAGEPSDLHFELVKPEPEVKTEVVERDRDQKKSDQKKSDRKKQDQKQGGGGAGNG